MSPTLPDVGTSQVPSYGMARVRTHSSPDLALAVYPDVLFRFLPQTEDLSVYFGHALAFDLADPSSTINLSLLDAGTGADEANEVSQVDVAGMDPRLQPETPIAEQGAVRIYQRTERPLIELPPNLHGCHITMRHGNR